MADAEAELRNLVHKRGAVKARLTRFATYMSTVNTDNELQQVKLRHKKLETVWDDFDVIQTSIELLDEPDAVLHQEERETFENNYFSVMAEVDTYLKRYTPVLNHIPRNEGLTDGTAQVKLPTINLPSFNGAYDQWMPFIDTFQSLIHENNSIAPIQKFHYLRSALTDEAAQVIHSLDVSTINYDIAWDLLKERFDNKRIIVQNHVKAIFEFPALTRESHTTLRQLLDTTTRHLRALKSLELPVESWDTILVHLISSKFDNATKREWESIIDSKKLPTMTDLNKFLEHRCHLLQSISSSIPPINVKLHNQLQPASWPRYSEKGTGTKVRGRSQSYVSTNRQPCPKCNQSHLIYQCPQFTTLSASERLKEVKRLNLCINCLRSDHHANQCSSGNCRLCARKHNTLLHLSGEKPVQAQGATNQHSLISVGSRNTACPAKDATYENVLVSVDSGENILPITSFSAQHVLAHSTVREGHAQGQPKTRTLHTENGIIVLSTARVIVYDNNARPRECRALLDSGSQSSFITQDLAQRLGLTFHKMHVPVSGINQSITPVTHFAKTKIKSRINNFQAQLSFLVLNTITERLPSLKIKRDLFRIPENLSLADPAFDTPGPIDMLIGAELFWELLCVGQIRKSNNLPILQKTYLGWVVSGPFNPVQQTMVHKRAACFLSVQQDLQDQLQKFWVIEEATQTKHLSPEEANCEAHFITNTRRDVDGRFIVRLPFRADPSTLGDSCNTAHKRLSHLERKFTLDPEFRDEYNNDLNDYISKGHMQEVLESSTAPAQRPVYYLPHHAVRKDQGESTKLRVVFDASTPSDNGTSLNDILMVGPTIQNDLQSIVIRFRIHRHVITGDIIKMYRQIQVHYDDIDLQRILWRPVPNGPIRTYRLKTVTFGTSAAPFLATRCLYQLAIENQETFPETSNIIAKDFYVDDLITGSNTRSDVSRIKDEIVRMLAQAGMKLHKWNSTCKELRDETRSHPEGTTAKELFTQDPVKTLGIFWDSENDILSYSVKSKQTYPTCTKRIILTIIAGIFDPLGLLGPVIVKAKILLQQLWELKTGWDEAVSQDIFTKWQTFEQGLASLNSIKIPRRINPFKTVVETHLHGFADASEKAYGACLYICTVNDQGLYASQLLCARSRVAPLKTLSIPRLELCSALLLAQLVNKVIKTLNCKPLTTMLWSDSTVTLAWIASSPHRWKIFVANRVAEIQTLTANFEWLHVGSEENPADMLSRGCNASQINSENALWWHGPSWLKENRKFWPTQNVYQRFPTEIPELRMTISALVGVSEPAGIFNVFSSLRKLINVVAYCLRFRHNSGSPADHVTGPLQVNERNLALHRLIRLAQNESFKQEIQQLSTHNEVQSTSRLRSLSPFLDDENLLRVGGRIQRATVDEEQKHPLLLPPNHPLTKLIISDVHVNHLHSGALGTLAAVRQRFWPLSGRRTIQGVIRNCITCFRLHPRHQTPAMGQLPASRVNPSRPFSTCGVDFAGPFLLRQGGPRSKTRIKAYMAVFVCFASRATHLELVSSLSSEAFIACLKRFIGRRGKPYQIFSDNATNFAGANKELRRLRKQFFDGECHSRVSSWLADRDIRWNFIPPASPHFGGIWEAGVKVAKRHIIPVVGNAVLTFEELSTLLVQAESCLNSRPLSPISSDPNDLSILTPGHFLIGSALSAVEEPSLQELPVNKLSRWQHVQKLTQHFWTRWSREYLSHLQQRQKWCKSTPPVVIGSLVLICDERTPPLKWPLGRITQVHPGQDSVVRVATVRTASGTFKRAITKLCILPLE